MFLEYDHAFNDFQKRDAVLRQAAVTIPFPNRGHYASARRRVPIVVPSMTAPIDPTEVMAC